MFRSNEAAEGLVGLQDAVCWKLPLPLLVPVLLPLL
jgi:hypothetical protein